jgi:hypothetical protein
VGAYGDSEGWGAVWILFLNAGGGVKGYTMTSSPVPGYFGKGLAALGDLDGDGVIDLAVGAPYDADPDYARGSVFVVFLNADGTAKAFQKISSTQGGFTGRLESYHLFGFGLAAMGDLDGDGHPDLAVGAPHDHDGNPFSGAVWLLFLRADGTVKGHRKISNRAGNLLAELEADGHFGNALAAMGDVNGDGTTDLAVAQYTGEDAGAVWIVFLDHDSTVRGQQKISRTQGGFTGDLLRPEWFGRAVAGIGDLDGDGLGDLAVGTFSEGSLGTGGVWILFLDAGPIRELQSAAQRRCIVSLNGNLAKVVKARAKQAASCLDEGARGAPPGRIESCLASDPGGKVASAAARTVADEGRHCLAEPRQRPDFGPGDAAAVNDAALAIATQEVYDVFGADLDAAVSRGPEAWRCQRKVAKAVGKCRDTSLAAFVTCKANGLKLGEIQSLRDLAV